MKRISYDANGDILDVREYPDTKSMKTLYITEDEYRILHGEKGELSKSTLINLLANIVTTEYEVYKQSSLFDFFRINEFNGVEISDIGDKLEERENALMNLLRSYSQHNSLPDEDIRLISCNNWFGTILFHVDKVRPSAWVQMRHGVEVVTDLESYLITLLNLIRKYYYALRSLELNKDGEHLPSIQRQIAYLSPFVNPKKSEGAIDTSYFCLKDNLFTLKLLDALYITKGAEPHELYSVLYVIRQLGESIMKLPDKHMLSYNRNVHEAKPIEPFTIYLTKYYGGIYEYEFTSEDYYSLRHKGQQESIINDFKQDLTTQYSLYRDDIQERWKKQVANDATRFFLNNNIQESDWQRYYAYYAHMIKEDWLKFGNIPQYCFRSIISKDVNPDSDVEFNKNIIVDLISTLRDIDNTIDRDCIKCEDERGEYGIYEALFKFNYIRGLASGVDRTVIDSVNSAILSSNMKECIERSLSFISCIFEPGNLRDNSYSNILRSTFKEILSNSKILPHLLKVNDFRGFNGGFNLPLVYNIIGSLYADDIRDKEKIVIFSKTRGEIALEIAQKNNQISPRKGKGYVDRRHQIETWRNEDSYLRENELLGIVKGYRQALFERLKQIKQN